jgi:hypothetical protein
LPSQLPKPASQLGEPHWPAAQVPDAWGSEHELPFGPGTCRQPSTGSQLPTWQGALLPQLGAVPAAHAPAIQTSTPLQALPSEHEVPSAAFA